MTAIIKTEHVNMWYERGKPNEVQGLKNVTLEIERGDYVAFFGPSGSGKTTMLYAIAGIDRYQEGKIFINGRDITGLSNKELAIFRQTGIGIVFQQFNLVPSLTVIQNVALPMAFIGISAQKSEIEAQKLLERLNIGRYRDRYPSELSGGQQQRVGIARALANNPPIIIADEPLGNLDSVNSKNVLEFFKELNEKDGRTIIMVTHEAWSLRDVKTVFYMKDGEITGTEHPTPKTAAEALSEHLYKEMNPNQAGKNPEEEAMIARALSNFLIRGYSLDEIRRFEFFLNERFSGKIDPRGFRESIDRSYHEGGVGLWRKKAERVSAYVEAIISERKDVGAIYKIIGTHPELSIMDEVRRIRQWLTSDYVGKLSDVQITALDQVISDRIRNFISTDKFRDVLDLSKKEFGVGLTIRTANKLTEKMEAILAGNAGTSSYA